MQSMHNSVYLAVNFFPCSLAADIRQFLLKKHEESLKNASKKLKTNTACRYQTKKVKLVKTNFCATAYTGTFCYWS